MEVGERIKSLRRVQGMTLDELSKKSDVSRSLLSMVERNISAPTVRTLEKIVVALGTTISDVYHQMESEEAGEVQPPRISVLKKNERKTLVLGPERGKAHYQLLTPDYRRKLEIMYIHFPVGKKTGRFITHEGEECGIILEGRLIAHIGDEEFLLEEGDTICFDSSTPHYWENAGEIEVRLYLINTPASF
jgi:transcriptional regulator with XRE-family HTH domain